VQELLAYPQQAAQTIDKLSKGAALALKTTTAVQSPVVNSHDNTACLFGKTATKGVV